MIRLIIPIEIYRKGGVEKVIVSLIPSLLEYVEIIIIILSRKDLDYFKSKLPKSERIIYDIFDWNQQSLAYQKRLFFYKIKSLFSKLKLTYLEQGVKELVEKVEREERIEHLIKKYQATHCLYFLTNTLTPPKISIPLAFIAYDLFWHFAPLTYSKEYRKKYDRSLAMWLEKASFILTISEQTRQEILQIFPQIKCQDKIKAVLLSGFSADGKVGEPQLKEHKEITFYFPSSLGIYKDHLTLLKAGIKLAKKNLDFKIIFLGKETDNLINGTMSLSGQTSTKEYEDYLQECQEVYQANMTLIKEHFLGLGYCEDEQVEYHYQTCDCVVVPSQYEGFGLAVSEGIVRGVPVIASDLNIFKEQAELYQCQDRLEFFEPGDDHALADCLERFILKAKPRLSQEEIKNRFGHWTWQKVAQEYLKYLEEIR